MPADIPPSLATILDDAPDLTGAACKGHGPLFDDREKGESSEHFAYRLGHARRLCADCPVARECANYADSLPRAHRTGIYAGTLWRHRRRDPVTSVPVVA